MARTTMPFKDRCWFEQQNTILKPFLTFPHLEKDGASLPEMTADGIPAYYGR